MYEVLLKTCNELEKTIDPIVRSAQMLGFFSASALLASTTVFKVRGGMVCNTNVLDSRAQNRNALKIIIIIQTATAEIIDLCFLNF